MKMNTPEELTDKQKDHIEKLTRNLTHNSFIGDVRVTHHKYGEESHFEVWVECEMNTINRIPEGAEDLMMLGDNDTLRFRTSYYSHTIIWYVQTGVKE